MTDGHGRTVDFKNTIIIMTSNVGSRWIQELGASKREEMEARVTEAEGKLQTRIFKQNR
jgi:ATP-dependent Clp protease ATP-binding subunit ClpB